MIDAVARAKELRKMIERLAENLTDEEAVHYIELFQPWRLSKAYKVGERVSFGKRLYKVIEEHTSSVDKRPDESPELFEVLEEREEVENG